MGQIMCFWDFWWSQELKEPKNTGGKYLLPLRLTPPKTTEGLFMSYQLGTSLKAVGIAV